MTGEPDLGIKWDQHPWSSDGLWPLMEAEMQRIQSVLDAGAAVPPGKIVKTQHAGEGVVVASVSTVVVGGPLDYLTYTVKLLAGIRWDTLDKLDAASEGAKRLSVYRGIRTQKFLEFTEQKIREREDGLRAVRGGSRAARRGTFLNNLFICGRPDSNVLFLYLCTLDLRLAQAQASDPNQGAMRRFLPAARGRWYVQAEQN